MEQAIEHAEALDRVNTDKIEFCDLSTADKSMIRIKRYGGSSVLSHLFAQGLISAETFRSVEGFRRKFEALLPRSQKLGAGVRDVVAPKYEVVFGIISMSPRPLNLPLFSQVNLRSAGRRLIDYGFRVRLLKISAH